MPRVIIRGLAAVFCEEREVTDPSILRTLDGVTYDEEQFTDYLGDTGEEGELASALMPGGHLHFTYREGDELLGVTTEFRSYRLLSAAELQFLIDYTMGQWSDGIGENWACASAKKCGYMIMCLDRHDGDSVYPQVEMIDDERSSRD